MIGRAVNDPPPNSSDNLAALGHITIFFTEEGECLPGSIRVKGKEFPKIEKESKIQEIINRINEETLVDAQEIDDAYAAKYRRLPQHPYYSNRLSEEG